jgi:hypothetical protein
MKNNKKGQIAQIFFILGMLLFLGMFGLITLKIAGGFNNGMATAMVNLNSSTNIDTTQMQGAMSTIQQVTVPAIDYFIFFFFLLGMMGLILGAVKTKFSPVITFIWIFMLLLAIFISSGLVNIYQEFAQSSYFLDISLTQHLTNIIFSRYMPAIICALGGIIILIMYSKSGVDL